MSRINHVSSRLAARGGIRQVEASLRADAAAVAVDRVVVRVWRRLLAILQRQPHWAEGHRQAATLFADLPRLVHAEAVRQFSQQAKWGWRSAVADVARTVPVRTLAIAGAAKLTEGRVRLWEDESARDPLLILRDLFAPAREPAESNPLAYLRRLLFPPPSDHDISRIVFGGDWQARLAAGTRLAAPELLANAVAGGLARGQTQQEIARTLAPLVQNVRSSARRIARTECLRVAGETQLDYHRQLGPLVIAYQVHATLDQHTRPWHAHRSGTIYYLDPKPGQKGMRQCPHPPDEAEDPAERPAGTPQTAWNCRCYLTPVLRLDKAIAANPVFTTPDDKLIPDPVVYSDWFYQADERRRRVAVGSRRYALVQDRAGERPPWEAFLSPEGELLSLAALRAETPVQRGERVAKVRAAIGQRRKELSAVSRFGFLPE